MATISLRGEFQWQARIRRAGYPQQQKTFETKVEAEAWVRDIENKMDRGIFVDTGTLQKIKLITLLERYEKEITPTKKGSVQEKSKLKLLKKNSISKMSIGRIQPGDIVDYRDSRIEEVGPATVAKEMNLLSNVFNIARSEWRMRGLENPVLGVRRPKQPPGRERRLHSGEEMDRILNATQSETLKIIIPLAVETAMRRGEMVSIKRTDIDFDEQTIHLTDTKNGTSRTVPLSLAALDILRSAPNFDEAMFSVKPNAVTMAFSRAVKRARATYEKECKVNGKTPNKGFLTNLRLHDMRHEATSRLFEDKNLEIMEVMSITGHSDTRQLKRYTHYRARRIAKKLG